MSQTLQKTLPFIPFFTRPRDAILKVKAGAKFYKVKFMLYTEVFRTGTIALERHFSNRTPWRFINCLTLMLASITSYSYLIQSFMCILIINTGSKHDFYTFKYWIRDLFQRGLNKLGKCANTTEMFLASLSLSLWGLRCVCVRVCEGGWRESSMDPVFLCLAPDLPSLIHFLGSSVTQTRVWALSDVHARLNT